MILDMIQPYFLRFGMIGSIAEKYSLNINFKFKEIEFLEEQRIVFWIRIKLE